MSDDISSSERLEFYVYGLVDPRINMPFYIGKGVGKRAQWHTETIKNGKRTDNYRKDSKIKQILDVGLEPIIIKYKENLLEIDAYEYEAELIIKYGRKYIDKNGILTNISPGGAIPNNTGRTQFKKGHTPWNKGKTGVQSHSKRTREKMSNSRMGKQYALGSKWSKESRTARSIMLTGRLVSEETRKKIREGNLGKIVSNETRIKQSNTQKNRPTTTDDARQHMKEGQARRKLSLDYNSEKSKEGRRLQSLQSWETRRKHIAEGNIQCPTL